MSCLEWMNTEQPSTYADDIHHKNSIESFISMTMQSECVTKTTMTNHV